MTIPSDKVLEIMRECVHKIDNFICDMLTEKVEEMPDVEESKAIFIDSVIIGSFCFSFKNRMQFMDVETKKDYIKYALRYIDNVLNNSIIERKEDDGIEN